MKSLFASCIALLGMISAAQAEQPTLNGALFNQVNTTKSRYAIGEIAHVQVTLLNNTGSTFTGALSGIFTSRGRAGGSNISIPVTSLAAGASAVYDMGFTPTNQADFRGYFVQLEAFSGASLIDSASASFSVESIPYIYPRYCFASYFTSGAVPALDVTNMNAWRCNGYQLYDVAHRQATPYQGGSGWANLSNTIINAGTFESWIAQAKQRNAFTFLFNDMGTADSTWAASGEALSSGWLLYTASTPTSAVTLNYPAAGGANCFGGTGFFPGSWQSPYIVALDPTNTGWQQYSTQADSYFVRMYGLDGINLDTLGNPSCTGVYKATGSLMTYASALGSIYSAMKSSTGYPMVIQDELQENVTNVLAQNPTFYLSELHPNFAYPQTYALIATSANNVRIINFASPPVFMVYSNETYAQTTTSCSTDGGSGVCYFNNPGVFYKDDLLMAAGTWPMDITDGTDNGVHLVSNIYVPGTAGQLAMNAAMLEGQQDRRNFGVAFEKLLRQGTLFDSAHATTCTSVATCGSGGGSGAVYVITETRPGFQMVNFLNYSQLNAAQINDASDTNANYPAPTQLTNVPVKMYYGGAVTGSNLLWFASPDVNHGAPQSLSYTKSSDGGGNYITATLPSLLYWDFLFLELDSLSSSDYASP